jgi:hypothetical protein
LCGSSDFVDERPLDVILAQLARAARPAACANGLDERRAIPSLKAVRYETGRLDYEQAAGLFPFRLEEVLVSIKPGERGDLTMRPLRQDTRAPSAQLGGNPDGGDRVTQVVLAIRNARSP